ncbi:glutamate receptor 2.2-like [Populus alba]|uniref:glutamate receptor 2.2-like n=1 Tax=Populus alba TaxID=43335 RepID=UPI003CC77AC8
MGVAQNTTSTIPVNVGVVLDFASLGAKIALSCINMALSDFYASHGDYKTRLVLNTRDSKEDVIGAAAAGSLSPGLDKKCGKCKQSLGPNTSMQANFVIDLGEKLGCQLYLFLQTSPSLTSIRSSYFLRATQNDSAQVNAISAIVQAFGWREAVPIYIDNEYGEGIIPYLIDALQDVDARVPYRSVISSIGHLMIKIVEELYKLMTMQTRVFIFTKIILSPIYPRVLGIKPYVPRTKDLEYFRARWKRKFLRDNPNKIDAELNIYGQLAYDATKALALAVEKAGTTNFGFRKANVSSNSSTDLATLGISLNGPNILRALSTTSFKGLTGDYLFVDGQLQSPAFQIVNVNGNGGRRIGFWTPTEGLVKTLNPRINKRMSSTSTSRVSTVIFPGETTVVPKGWEIPTNEKKLKIRVPVKSGFIRALPYALPYEYIPFANSDGEPAGTYNDLAYQVYLKNYDAAVGDITIVYNRSLYIDYTLPFTESGVSMIVPIADNNSKNAWAFMKPLTWDLWSYTSRLASYLTVKQLQPTVTDVRELIKKGEYVGYQKGSFVLGLLLDLGFDRSKLMVFPKGSPLVPHISRAILNVTEGDKMKRIEDAWTSCIVSSHYLRSHGLEIQYFQTKVIEMASVWPTNVRAKPISLFQVDKEYPANRSSASYDSSPNREAPQEVVRDHENN